jgi:organic hydroperoxide reductase OsmC/OhrA
VVLNPVTQIKGHAEVKLLEELHLKAHHLCFIANSVKFPVRCNPSFEFV